MKSRLLIASFVSLGLTWSASSFAVAYKIDPAQSTVKWAGKSVKGAHDGTVKLKEGTLDFDGKEGNGRFVIDVTSIQAMDLRNKNEIKDAQKLEGHLRSDDFFSTSKHPEATFVLKSLKPDPDNKGMYVASGDLTIKGSTNPVSMAKTEVTEKDGKVKISSEFTIDRTLWNVRYNSGKDVKGLGDKLISDDVKFNIDLVGVKK